MAIVSRNRGKSFDSTSTASRNRRHRFKSFDSTSTASRSKSDLWRGALEKDLGDGIIIQMCGLGSEGHVVYARMKPAEKLENTGGESPTSAVDTNADGTDGSEKKQGVTLGKVIEILVDEGHRSIAKSILEQHVHIQPDSYPSAAELLQLGSVWILNETLYSSGSSAHAKRLTLGDVDEVPAWNDMTLRVHYVPDRFHAVHEVDWGKHCRGMLLDGSVGGAVGGVKVVVPMTGLPDKIDGVLVYEVCCSVKSMGVH